MKPVDPWRLVTWTDAEGRMVRELACHEDELAEVLNLPFWPGAVCREPVIWLPAAARDRHSYFRRKYTYFKPGDDFEEFINQGYRPCTVLAVDDMGRVLYEYDMPNGRTFTRIDGRPVNRNRLSKKWQELIQ